MSEFSIRTKTFRLSLADYRALWLAEAHRPSYLFPIVLFYGLPVLVAGVDWRDGHCTTYLWTLTTCLIAAGCLAIPAFVLSWHHLRQDPLANGDRIVILDAGALRLIGYGLDRRQAWSAFRDVHNGRNHIFFRTPGQATLVLPKRALASPDEAHRLVKLARTAIRSSRQTPSVLPALAEPPDNREIWRSNPYRMVLQRPLNQLLLRGLAISILIPGFLLLAVLAKFGGKIAWNLNLLIVMAVFMAGYACLFLVVLLLVWLIMRQSPFLRGDLEVCFTRDYVRCTGLLFDSRLDWTNGREVRHAPGVLIFRLPNGFIHVPASAFTTPAQAKAFFTQAVAFWRAAEARQ